MPGTAVITGGCGFVGRKLSQRLLTNGGFSQTVLCDILPPREPLLPGEEYVHCSTCDAQGVKDCLLLHSPVSVVFHVAAYGMTGAASLDKQKTYAVNVEGTRAVIAACLAAGVPSLVYTSTCNVVFGGRPIIMGDESLPYYPPHKHVDYYSSSKTIAEMTVLAANGTPLAAAAAGGSSTVAAGLAEDAAAAAHGRSSHSPGLLRTCALRPNGIYGAGEEQHSMRVLRMADQGLLVATFGPPGVRQDWTHVDNLVEAQVLAAAGLTADKGYIAAGQAYFIVDPEPFNSSEFLRPLVEGLGYKMPSLRLPLWLMYKLAFLMELLYRVLPRWLGFQPIITRNEVRKAAVTHYFSWSKAQQQLGYKPTLHSPAEYVPWFLERGFGPGPDRRSFISSQQLLQQQQQSQQRQHHDG